MNHLIYIRILILLFTICKNNFAQELEYDDELKCASGQVIGWSKRCNSEYDCDDGTDEKDCDATPALFYYFLKSVGYDAILFLEGYFFLNNSHFYHNISRLIYERPPDILSVLENYVYTFFKTRRSLDIIDRQSNLVVAIPLEENIYGIQKPVIVSDSLTGNIYIQKSLQINLCDKLLKYCIIVTRNSNRLINFIFYERKGWLIWASINEEKHVYQILRSERDGRNVKVIKQSSFDLNHPCFLTIDVMTEKLYWTINTLTNIDPFDLYSSDLDGQNTEFHKFKGRMESIFIHENYIYWFENRGLWKQYLINSLKSPPEMIKNFSAVHDQTKNPKFHVIISSENKQSSACLKAAVCSHFCSVSSNNEQFCYCYNLTTKELNKVHSYCPELTVFVGVSNSIHILGLYERDYNLFNQQSVTMNATTITAIAYSVTNESLIFADGKNKLYSWNPATREQRLLYDLKEGVISALSYDLLGNNLYIGRSSNSLIEVFSLNTMYVADLTRDNEENLDFIPADILLIPQEKYMFVLWHNEKNSTTKLVGVSMDADPTTVRIINVIEGFQQGDTTLLDIWNEKNEYFIYLYNKRKQEMAVYSYERNLRTNEITIITLPKLKVETSNNGKVEAFVTMHHHYRKTYSWIDQKMLYFHQGIEFGDSINEMGNKNLDGNSSYYITMIVMRILPFNIKSECRDENGKCEHICVTSIDGSGVCKRGKSVIPRNKQSFSITNKCNNFVLLVFFLVPWIINERKINFYIML